MLGKLDNQVIFKKAFTDKIVLEAFVKDVLGIEFEAATIETEKQFSPKVGNIDFKLDIFAESVDQRVVVEVQRVQYDRNFDRFLHYFLMTITEQQRPTDPYKVSRTVYVIVVMTAPYKFDTKKGEAVRDEVLLLKLNPKTLTGVERDIYGHQLVCLNPNHPSEDTPAQIRDWLDLIYQSIHSPERPVINEANPGVRRAAELISHENLTPEEWEASKMEAMRKEVVAMDILEREREIAKAMKTNGEPVEKIMLYTSLSAEEIGRL